MQDPRRLWWRWAALAAVGCAAACAEPASSPSAAAAKEPPAPRARAAAPPGERAARPGGPATAVAPAAQGAPHRIADVELARGEFNSARSCGACHQEIYATWSRSMHAQSFRDPIFREAYFRAFFDTQGKAASLCLRCHSPTVATTGDVWGSAELTGEGVTCDYCHSVGGLGREPSGQLTYQIDWTRKFGPFPNSVSPAHEVAYRPYFERSEICAGCHDFPLPSGAMLFATYSEWRASSYARDGVQCQECHMPRLPGATAAAEVKGTGRMMFNDHNLVGGHSATQVKRAVDVRVEGLTRDADRVRLVVALENVGAGHYVPTGIPSRRLVLTVTALQRGRRIFQRETVYQRLMEDEHERTLTEDWEIKLKSRNVQRDNRLAPGEVRLETFVFTAAHLEEISVQVRLAYEYVPRLAAPQPMEHVLSDFEHLVPRGS